MSILCFYKALFCLFVWFLFFFLGGGGFRPTGEFSTHFETTTHFDIHSALMAIEQWRFFNVPLLLWHGATIYSAHLRGTHTCCRALGNGSVTTCFKDLGLSRRGIETRSPACEASALLLRHNSGDQCCNVRSCLFTVFRCNVSSVFVYSITR